MVVCGPADWVNHILASAVSILKIFDHAGEIVHRSLFCLEIFIRYFLKLAIFEMLLCAL